MKPFKVICINDSQKPDGIPTSRWIVKDVIYTVIHVAKMANQNGMLGFKLQEINIDDCFPYQFFSANRFAPYTKLDSDLEEELERILQEAKEEYELKEAGL